MRHVVLASTTAARFAGRLNGRKEEADERADNGDDNEQFNQRETVPVLSDTAQTCKDHELTSWDRKEK